MIEYYLKFKHNGVSYTRICKIHPMYKRTISLKDNFSDFVHSIVSNIEEAENLVTKSIANSNYYFA